MKEILIATVMTLFTFQYFQDREATDFDKWQQRFGKNYMGNEKIYRQSVYDENKKIIENHNKLQSYTMGENQFMALTKDEFKQLFLNGNHIEQTLQVEDSKSSLHAVDWRDYSTVKTQGNCAAGWAFSLANSMEAWYYIRGGKNISVSAQQFVDCDTNSQGCTGGVNTNAMFYAQQNGLQSSTTYPYVAAVQTCKINNGSYKINNYTFVGGSSSALQSALQNYPVSIGVDASEWQFYSSGLFQECVSNITNHYALAVGFDLNNNWIVQNSFGSSWGDQGYITLYPNNTCGILNQAYQIL